MNHKSDKSLDLYILMRNLGYPVEFCEIISDQLNTDWTAGRMLGYLSKSEPLPLEMVADEMFAILSDRDRIMNKKINEHVNMNWNRHLMNQYCNSDIDENLETDER